MVLPGELEISISDVCCLKCEYCIKSKYKINNKYCLNSLDIIKGLEFYFKHFSNIKFIERIGFVDDPDPLQFWKTLKDSIIMIRKFYGNDLKIEVQTSGVFLNEEKLKFLINNNCYVVLRIDGDERITNENKKFRNSNKLVFSVVYKNIATIKREYLEKVYVAPTFTKKTFPKIDESFKFLYYDLGFRKFQYKNMQLCEIWTEYDLEATKYALLRFKNEVIKVLKKEDHNFELFLSSFLNRSKGNVLEFILRPNRKFYIAYSPPDFDNDFFCVGDFKKGIYPIRFLEIKRKVTEFFKKEANIKISNFYNPYLLFITIKLVKENNLNDMIISNLKLTELFYNTFNLFSKIFQIKNKDPVNSKINLTESNIVLS